MAADGEAVAVVAAAVDAEHSQPPVEGVGGLDPAGPPAQ